MKIKLNEVFPAYELIDCGNGKKLERFGEVILIRPEITAKNTPNLSTKEWKDKAYAEFIESSKKFGQWELFKKFDSPWEINYQDEKIIIKAILNLTESKHIGIFPEQIINWNYLKNNYEKFSNSAFLNLFGYTGLTSLAAAHFFKQVTHIDSIKKVIDWTKANQKISDINNLRVICEDASKFVLREVKRKNKYSGIILDPPPIGQGAKNEKWVLSKMLDELLKNISLILEEKSFVIMNLYSHSVDEHFINEIIVKNFPKHKTKLKERVFGLSQFNNTIDHGVFVHLEN